MYTLENEFLRIKVREHGGELREVLDRQDGTQYLWDGNPEYWQYSSPVLFPIVGRVKNNKYRYQGQEYEIPSHGIGRISEYKLAGQTENSITMALDYDEETLKVYPFKFRLEITYRLEGKSVAVHWKVINADDKEMYFPSVPIRLCAAQLAVRGGSRTAIWIFHGRRQAVPTIWHRAAC